MNTQNAVTRCRSVIRVLFQFCNAHRASRKALQKVYVRTWREAEPSAEYLVQLLINPHGQLFKVTRRYFVNGNYLREHSFLAIYGWGSSGHLYAIGSNSYVFLEPEQQLLYLEENAAGGEIHLETYQKSKI